MVWAKLTDDFPDRAARADLSDAAFRTHVEALCWVMRRETGGALTARDLRRCAETPEPESAVAELVAAGWWHPTARGWQVVESMADQPDPETLEARRQMDAERQRRKRRKAARLDPDDVSRRDAMRDDPRDAMRDDPRDAMRDDPRDPGRDGSGRGGGDSTDRPINGWPVPVPVPDGCVVDGCTSPPRRACWTCAEHMDREPVGVSGRLG